MLLASMMHGSVFMSLQLHLIAGDVDRAPEPIGFSRDSGPPLILNPQLNLTGKELLHSQLCQDESALKPCYQEEPQGTRSPL